jgi:hypothetical protein
MAVRCCARWPEAGQKNRETLLWGSFLLGTKHSSKVYEASPTMQVLSVVLRIAQQSGTAQVLMSRQEISTTQKHRPDCSERLFDMPACILDVTALHQAAQVAQLHDTNCQWHTALTRQYLGFLNSTHPKP